MDKIEDVICEHCEVESEDEKEIKLVFGAIKSGINHAKKTVQGMGIDMCMVEVIAQMAATDAVKCYIEQKGA